MIMLDGMISSSNKHWVKGEVPALHESRKHGRQVMILSTMMTVVAATWKIP